MAVTPNPKPPKLPKQKTPKKKSGGSSKGFSTSDLTNYLLMGGSLSDIAGNKISQGQVLSALSDPQALKIILDSLSSSYGNTGTYDPSRDYSQDVPTFEATYNPIASKYATVTGPEASLVQDFFDAINSGQDPNVVASKLLDKNFVAKYGLDSSNPATASLLGQLGTDAPKYAKAEVTRQAAIQKQNYDAWRKGVMSKGATPSEYIAKALGIPALKNLPDPTMPYSATPEELASSPSLMKALGLASPALTAGPYVPTAAERAAAQKYASQFKGPRADQTTQQIDEAFGAGGFSRPYLPESILGNKIWGMRGLNQLIGGGVAGVVKGAGFVGTGGGYNPLQRSMSPAEMAAGDKAAQQKAYEDFLSRTTRALNQKMAEDTRQRVLRAAAAGIGKKGLALQQKGITPFSQQLQTVQAILGGSRLPIVKSK